MQLDFLFPFFLSFVWFVLWTMDPQRNPGIRRFGSYVNEYFSYLSVIDVPAEFPRVIRERKGGWVPVASRSRMRVHKAGNEELWVRKTASGRQIVQKN